jgi:Rod binding domain-containing protein
MDIPQIPVAAVDPDDARLSALRRGGGAAASKTAAQEVEVLFMTQLIRAMRKTIPESDFLPRSPARDVLDGAFDRSLATALAARDPLGLVRSLGALKPEGVRADTVNGKPGTADRKGTDQG